MLVKKDCAELSPSWDSDKKAAEVSWQEEQHCQGKQLGTAFSALGTAKATTQPHILKNPFQSTLLWLNPQQSSASTNPTAYRSINTFLLPGQEKEMQ